MEPSQDSRTDRPLLAIAFKAGATMSFASMAAIIKLLGDGFPVGQIIFFRTAFALVPVLVWAGATGQLAQAWRTTSLTNHVRRSGIGIIAMLLSFLALEDLKLADWTAISFAMPIFGTVLAFLILKEPIGLWRAGAVAAGFAGVLIMVAPKLALDEGVPALIMLASTLCSGFVIVVIRSMSATENPLSIVFYFMLVCALLSGVSLPFAFRMPDGFELALLIGSGIFGGLGQIGNTFAYSHAQPSMLGPFDYLAMIWAVAFGAILFSEWPDAYVWTGASIVIAAGLVIGWREHVKGLDRTAAAEEAVER